MMAGQGGAQAQSLTANVPLVELQGMTGSAPAPGRPAGSQVPSVDFAEQLRADIVGVLEAQHVQLQRQLQNQLELQHQRLFAALEATTHHREAAHGGAPVKPDADGGTDEAHEVGQWLGQGSAAETLADAAASNGHDMDETPEHPLPYSASERAVLTLRKLRACAFPPKAGNDERPFLRRCIENKVYDFVVMVLVISYSGFIGWQVQASADRSADAAETTPADENISLEPLSTEMAVDRFYLAVFFSDIVLRLAAYGCGFFRGSDWTWNWFDLMAVGTMALEFFLDVIAGTGGTRQDDSDLLAQVAVLRILRVVRMVRVVRIMRVMKFFKELRLMLVSMMASCRSLLWALLTLGMVNFLFGVTITMGVVDYLNEDNRWSDEESVEMVDYYGGLTRTMRTLFFAISGGADWGELWLLLYPLSPIYTGVFLVYVCFSMLAALNIVTSVFVEASIGMAQEDKEGLIDEAMKNKARYEAELVALFHQMDMDCSGSMTMDELRESLSDPRMRAYLATMEISIDDTETILMLFQASESGGKKVIDVEEFVYACLKLRGDAKAVDISMLQIQVKELKSDMRKLLVVAGRLDSRSYALRHGQSAVETTLSTCADSPPEEGGSGTEHEASTLTSSRERQTDVVQHPDEAALRPAEAGLPQIAEEVIPLAVADLPDDGSPSPQLVEETPVIARQQQAVTGGRATAAAWNQQEDVFGARNWSL